MGKSRAIYKPGELDKVRRKLGDIDPEEARRMAEVLGGEVGYEKDIEAIEREEKRRKVAQAAEDARKQVYEARVRERRLKAAEARKLAKTGSGASVHDEFSAPRRGYSSQLRMDFRCAHADHLIKTQGQALASLFHFLPGYRDRVNPYFVQTICAHAVDRVEKLVQAARFILPSKRPDLWARMRQFPLHFEIMECLATWNLDGLSGALGIIQGNPRDISVDQTKILSALVFKPLFRLQDAYDGTAFKAALSAAANIAGEASPGNRKSFLEAKEEALDEAEYLYTSLFYGWYPLLMRYCASEFHEFPEFYDECRSGILSFLGLRESEVIRDSGLLTPPSAKNAKPGAEEAVPGEDDQAMGAEPDIRESPDGEAEGPVEDAGEAEAAQAIPSAFRAEAEKPAAVMRGLELMDKIFPEAGWLKPEDSPDLYPYFNQLYPLPRGVDLIAPTDPLIQIICFNQALNDLFHGLRSITFGVSKDGASLDMNRAINEILNDWTQPVDEIVAKAYLPLLSEYCRLIETERESQNSAYAAKREADLIWYKKKYFLPYLSGTALSSVQNPRDKDVKILFKQTKALKGYLSMIAQDIDRSVKARKETAGGAVAAQSVSCSTIDNPFDLASFEVENAVSRRLRLILKREGPTPKRFTNAALIYFGLSILEAFDFFLNDPRSWAYRERRVLPYRELDSKGQARSLETIDAERAFLRELEAFDKAKQAEPARAAEPGKEPAQGRESAQGRQATEKTE